MELKALNILLKFETMDHENRFVKLHYFIVQLKKLKKGSFRFSFVLKQVNNLLSF